MTFPDKVMLLAVKHSVSITSWIRSKSRNKAVGGAPNSKHLMGLAVDVVLDDMSAPLKDNFINDAKKLGLWCLDEGDHIHIQEA